METVSAALAHDIGHELATLSCLVSAVRADPALSTLHADSHRRLGLIEREVERLQELVGLRSGTPDDTDDTDVSLRGLVAEVADPLALRGPATVLTDPSPDVRLPVDGRLLWRLLANLAQNAVRAAGPGGTVRFRIHAGPPPVVEIHDDGPGFGAGPSGHAGLGLPTAHHLAARCGAVVTFGPAAGGGTVATIHFRAPALIRGA
jgi:signal transduction histidine kinase